MFFLNFWSLAIAKSSSCIYPLQKHLFPHDISHKLEEITPGLFHLCIPVRSQNGLDRKQELRSYQLKNTKRNKTFKIVNEIFPKWIRNSVHSANTGNLINHWSMNWDKFKDPLCYLCLAGTVVASWSLTQEVGGSNNIFVTEFSENI